MDFRLSPTEARFQREVHDWLVANLPAGWGTPDYRKPEEPAEKVRFARWWQGKLCEGGWAGLHWPREYGGRGASPIEQFLFAEEYTRVGAPSMIDIGVGPALVGPTLIHHGTEQQKQRFLRKILTGDEMWCQGFSEPNAGSDLAAVRTRAELRGDAFHVSGQKIWTSYARFAERCILVTRTDVQAPKHKGITFLLVDMKTPGITIRPLVEMTGVAWFNEVFFDDVRVPRENVVGEVHQGWTIVMTTLAHERSGSAPHARLQGEMRDVLDLARRVVRDGRPAAVDPRLRPRLAQSFIETEILRGLAYKNVSELMRNGQPRPEGSCLKLVASEVQRNIIAQRVLGLPRA